MPIAKGEFERLCDLHDEGIFKAQIWSMRSEKSKWCKVRTGSSFFLEHEFGCHGNVRGKVQEMQSKASEHKVRVGVCVEVDEQVEKLVRHSHVRKEEATEKVNTKEFFWLVRKGERCISQWCASQKENNSCCASSTSLCHERGNNLVIPRETCCMLGCRRGARMSSLSLSCQDAWLTPQSERKTRTLATWS